MARRACCWMAHLVLVLVAAALCSADQQPEQHSGDPLEQLLALVSRAVTAAADPIVAELGSQRTLLDGIVSRLEGQDHRLDALNARLDNLKAGQDALNTRLGTLNASLGTLNASLDSQDGRLDSQDAGQAALNASLGTLDARVNSSVTAALSQALPRDCSDLPTGAGTGIYTLRLGGGSWRLADAYCDMETDGGGWTVFQRRADLLPRQNFFLDWAEYRAGFGNMTGEFWWGLQKLHLMTSARDRRYELRVDLGDFTGATRHALYRDFGVSSEEDGYRLTGGNYSGDAGDSLTRHFGMKFSTKDRDQDTWSSGHCAQSLKGAWWFHACAFSHLNGEYRSGSTFTGNDRGVIWVHWKGYGYSLKTAEMKVRPRRHV